jgi:hypothetical protein
MYIATNQLPESIQTALKSVSYNKKDIQVLIKEQESLFCCGGDGIRGFAVLVNLSTNENKVMYGSWGGANPFNPTNQVDLNDKLYTIPENGAVIKGYEGHGTSATVILSPKNIVNNLLTEDSSLSKDEKMVLGYFKYKSSYRKSLLESKKELVNKLVDAGYISKNKAGAMSLTLKGKNAAENVRVY